MNVGWIERLLLVAAVCGCERLVTDAPPPPTKHDIMVAPPLARGARAAGTDAAPKPGPFRQLERGPGFTEEPGEHDEPAPEAPPPSPGSAVPL